MYKVILFNYGSEPSTGSVLLDTSSGTNPGLTQAVVETKLNEAGSFTYSITPQHPLYNMTDPLSVYVIVEEDGKELFYGRILSLQTNPLTKIKSVTCEGALAFLLDSELDTSDEEWTCTARRYFKYCLDQHNDSVQHDKAREFKIGTLNVEESLQEADYKNDSYTDIQGVMKSKLLDVYDGYFRIRRDDSDGSHFMDWVKQVGVTNPQRIAITRNVVSQTMTESGEDIFTLMRPMGNDDITLSEGRDGLIPISEEMYQKYGAIVRTVSFDADDTQTLRGKAFEYIEKIKDRLSLSGDISFVDFHFLDDAPANSKKIHVGDVFTNIEGYAGVKLTADSVSRDLLNAGKDKLTLKNDKELMGSASSSGANSSSSTGVSSSGKSSSNSTKMYKFYHENATDASLAAKNLFISAEKKIEIRAEEVKTYADEIGEALSDEIGTVKTRVGDFEGEWTLYKGTEIYKNKEHIDQVCGLYTVSEYVDPLTGKKEKRLVINEGTALYQSRDQGIFGLYDSWNLQAGILIKKINGDQTETAIKGDKILLGPAESDKANTVVGITDGAIHFKRYAIFDGEKYTAVINNGKITAGDGVQIAAGKQLTFVGVEDDLPISLSYTDIDSMVVDAEVDTSTNTLKLWKKGDPANNPSITFNKAVTSLTGGWDGNKYEVVASPTVKKSTTLASLVGTGDIRVTGKNVAQTMQVWELAESSESTINTGATLQASINASQVYNNGWIKAAKQVKIPDAIQPGTEQTTFTILVPSDTTPDADPIERLFYLSKGTPADSGFASVNFSGRSIGNIQIGDWYIAGKDEGKKLAAVNGNWENGVYTAYNTSNTSKKCSTDIGHGTLIGTGSVSANGNNVTQNMVVYAAGSSENYIPTGATLKAIINTSSLLQPLTITKNNTYTPGSSYIGFSSVTVNVESSEDTTPITIDKGYTIDEVWEADAWYQGKITVRAKKGNDVKASLIINPPVTLTTQAEVAADKGRSKPRFFARVDGYAKTSIYTLLSRSTYTNENGVKTYCVNLHSSESTAEATTSSKLIGRISTQAHYNQGVKDGKAAVKLQDKDVTITKTTTIYPDSGYSGMSSIVVRVNKGIGLSLKRGTYNSYSRTYTWTTEISQSITGSSTNITAYY